MGQEDRQTRMPRHRPATYLLPEHPGVFYVNPQSLNARSLLCKQIAKEDPGIRRESLPESFAWTNCFWSTHRQARFQAMQIFWPGPASCL